ncbi:MAG: hypothetical protein Q8736_02730, partial [Sweet potato little leaf phytoplasma]|nr:hypothetical protein [Sweet potato little leaf phytoplasma]
MVEKNKHFYFYFVEFVYLNNLHNMMSLKSFYIGTIFYVILKIRRYDQLFFLIVNSLNIIISIIQEIKIKKTLDKIN